MQTIEGIVVVGALVVGMARWLSHVTKQTMRKYKNYIRKCLVLCVGILNLFCVCVFIGTTL